MSNDINILGNLVSFLLVGIVFIVVLAITFKVTLKNYNVKTSKIKFYGLFLGMDNRGILAFSLITLNSIFLIWCITTFSGLNIYYVFITVTLMILADIVIKDYNRIPIDLIYSMINMACIFVGCAVSSKEKMSGTYNIIDLDRKNAACNGSGICSNSYGYNFLAHSGIPDCRIICSCIR